MKKWKWIIPILVASLLFSAGGQTFITSADVVNFLLEKGMKVEFRGTDGVGGKSCSAFATVPRPMSEVLGITPDKLSGLGITGGYAVPGGLLYNIASVPIEFCFPPPGQSASEGETGNAPQPSNGPSHIHLPSLWPVVGFGLVMIFVMFGWRILAKQPA